MDGSMMTPTAAAAGPALDHYKRLFTEARDLTATARRRSQVYSRYYHNKQIDDATLRRLKIRKEPTFSINRVRPGVEGMVGVVERGKADPRALPRNGPDEQSAEVATDVLRYVSDINRWPALKLKTFRSMLVEGTAAVLIEVDAKFDTRFRRIRWEEFFYDPYSREPDFSDASYKGCAKWQYVDQVVSVYPEKEAQLRAVCSQGDAVESEWGDRPFDGSLMWTDPRRKRLLVVEMYHLYGGTWMKCVFVGSLKLEEGVSPYQDNDGVPCCPIEAQSAYVDDENNRYGVVEDMMGPQDEINVYRRKAAWLATFRQLQETDPSSAGIDPDEARKEAARPDGVIPAGWGVVSNADKFQMDTVLLQEAKGEIERSSVNPAIVARGDSSSGRQDLIRQQAGLTELAHLFAGLDDLEYRIYGQAWARSRQFMTEPKMLRVTDTEGEMKFLQINEPVIVGEEPVIDPVTGFPQYDPTTRQIVMRPKYEMKNGIAQMDVDIIIDSTPDTANVQQEQYSDLVELAKIGGLGPNPGPILLKASSIRNKRELLEQLKQDQAGAQGAQGGEPPPPSPEQQDAMQIARAARIAEIENTKAQTAEREAKAIKTMGDAQRDQSLEARAHIIGREGFNPYG